jgi:hypothetical protein
MARRPFLLIAALGAGVAAAVGFVRRRRKPGGAAGNGSRQRTEELRREIEAARARLRESIRTRDG